MNGDHGEPSFFRTHSRRRTGSGCKIHRRGGGGARKKRPRRTMKTIAASICTADGEACRTRRPSNSVSLCGELREHPISFHHFERMPRLKMRLCAPHEATENRRAAQCAIPVSPVSPDHRRTSKKLPRTARDRFFRSNPHFPRLIDFSGHRVQRGRGKYCGAKYTLPEQTREG